MGFSYKEEIKIIRANFMYPKNFAIEFVDASSSIRERSDGVYGG